MCEDLVEEIPEDYIRRPHLYWVALLIPGIIPDIIFLIKFWRPVKTT